ncbi:hypothetical protein C8J56DRAFT_286706 [Mycena floridula]|nr:hypothetical protein C8J56DRAFT_286706 [Mycena floridula]
MALCSKQPNSTLRPPSFMFHSFLSLAFILSFLLAKGLAAPVNGSCSGLDCPGNVALLVGGIAIVVLLLALFVLLRMRRQNEQTNLKAAGQQARAAERAVEQPGWVSLPIAQQRSPA